MSVGPFFHGTHMDLAIGDQLVVGHRSNYHEGRIANHVYFAKLLEPAIWGAELAVALGDGTGRRRIHVVEPTGPLEDDPNVTNKEFPGNVTQSYRTRHPMLIVDEVESWEGHPPEVVRGMLDNIAKLRAAGLDIRLRRSSVEWSSPSAKAWSIGVWPGEPRVERRGEVRPL